jgi:hypothetical protein
MPEVMEVYDNPHLPPAPEDGKHDSVPGGRCSHCGAYYGSMEYSQPCLGRFTESGKMRAHADWLWRRDRAMVVWDPVAKAAYRLEGSETIAKNDTSLDVWETGELASREVVRMIGEWPAPLTTPGTSFGGSPVRRILLACGHERSPEVPPWDSKEMDEFVLWRALTEGNGPTSMACLECYRSLTDSASGREGAMKTSLERIAEQGALRKGRDDG